MNSPTKGVHHADRTVDTMSASLTVSGINQWLSASALAAWVMGVPIEAVLGALAGAVIFVTFAVEYPIRRRLLLSVFSFFCGILFYKPISSILVGLSSMIPGVSSSGFERGIVDSSAAFVSAIVAVGVGSWLHRGSNNPGKLIPWGKDNDKS